MKRQNKGVGTQSWLEAATKLHELCDLGAGAFLSPFQSTVSVLKRNHSGAFHNAETASVECE